MSDPSGPADPARHRQTIEKWGPGGFLIAGVVHTRPVLVLPGRTIAWNVTGIADITPESLAPIAELGGIEILLIGTGPKMLLVPRRIKDALRQIGIAADAMDSAAACRTYSVLAAEDRRVAAALIPIGAA